MEKRTYLESYNMKCTCEKRMLKFDHYDQSHFIFPAFSSGYKTISQLYDGSLGIGIFDINNRSNPSEVNIVQDTQEVT